MQAKTPRRGAGFLSFDRRKRSFLDLGFLELDVLAHDGIVLLEAELFGRRARVLLGDVVKAGVGSRHEFDLDGGGFGHNTIRWGLAALGAVSYTHLRAH